MLGELRWVHGAQPNIGLNLKEEQNGEKILTQAHRAVAQWERRAFLNYDGWRTDLAQGRLETPLSLYRCTARSLRKI